MVDDNEGARGAARTLALVRMVAGLVIASSADVHNAPAFAALDAGLTALPSGLGWTSWLPLTPALAESLRWLVVAAALVGAVGAYARVSFSVVALGTLVLLTLPQRVGAVTHCHHLVWVAALLAVSPCADTWSADAYFDRSTLRSRGAYAVPLGFVRALVAAIYFFPGLHKLLAFLGGVAPAAWLQSQLDWKWMQAGHAPEVPLPTSPWLWTALALGAVLFELSMPLLIAVRRLRPLALSFAIVFHVATAFLLFIRFDSLAAVLVSLVDLRPRPLARASLLSLWRSSLVSTRVLGGLLLAGASVTGLLGATQLYPFACYPTFAEQTPATMPSAQVSVEVPGKRCLLRRPRRNAEWVQAFRIAGAYGDALTAARARSYVLQTVRSQNEDCPITADSQITLWLQQLAWDREGTGVRVVSERAVYTTLASSLGSAPADGTSSSSSPTK